MYAILIEICRFIKKNNCRCHLIDDIENVVGTVARYHLYQYDARAISGRGHRDCPYYRVPKVQVLTTFEENVRYATYLLYFDKLTRRGRKLT